MLRISSILLLLWIVSWSQRNRLPDASTVQKSLARPPLQIETAREPFSVRRKGVSYRIKPVAEYELRGLVVSYHNSDSPLDFYHRLWGDELNFRDLGVVWGNNALSGLYRDMKFWSRDFTLYYRTGNSRTWSRFRQDQVSNNHILAGDSQMEKRLRKIGKGDQILLRGVLCEYAHAGGSRGTSTTRTDRGNGACETIFVDSVTVLREANAGWRFLMSLSGLCLKLMIPVLLWQGWKALRPNPKPAGETWSPSHRSPAPPPLPDQPLEEAAWPP